MYAIVQYIMRIHPLLFAGCLFAHGHLEALAPLSVAARVGCSCRRRLSSAQPVQCCLQTCGFCWVQYIQSVQTQLKQHVKLHSPQRCLCCLQDHANAVLERIKKWRAAQLTPWKPKAGAGAAHSSSTSAGGSGAEASSKGTKSGSTEIQGPVARVYCLYSSMEMGSSCLGLHKAGFIRLLADARVIGGRWGCGCRTKTGSWLFPLACARRETRCRNTITQLSCDGSGVPPVEVRYKMCQSSGPFAIVSVSAFTPDALSSPLLVWSYVALCGLRFLQHALLTAWRHGPCVLISLSCSSLPCTAMSLQQMPHCCLMACWKAATQQQARQPANITLQPVQRQQQAHVAAQLRERESQEQKRVLPALLLLGVF